MCLTFAGLEEAVEDIPVVEADVVVAGEWATCTVDWDVLLPVVHDCGYLVALQ